MIIPSIKKLLFVTALFAHAAFAATEVRHFDIWEYRVDGNSLLSSAQIESTVYPYLGPARNLKAVEQAAAALQAVYKSNGYPLVAVNIPQQNVIGGVITLQVVEGRIDRVKISGNRYFLRSHLREELPALKRGSPLNMHMVRTELDDANRLNPYRSIVPVLRPGRVPGTMEVELKVKDRLPFHASVETNNRYTANTSRIRLNTSIGYDNLWLKSHSVSLSYQTAPDAPSEVSVYNLSYVMPVGESSRLALFAVDSNSEVTSATSQGDELVVLGKGKVYGLRAIVPGKISSSAFYSMIAGVDIKKFGEDQQLVNADGSNNLDIPIDYTGFTLSYNGTVKYRPNTTRFSISSQFGVRGLGNDAEEFQNKRVEAIPNYFYFKGSFNQNWMLNEHWQVFAGFRGQLTESPLISNEQFSVGGVDTVRGYIESSALGDNGILGNLELHYNLWTRATRRIQAMDVSLFVDSASLRILDALPDTPDEYHLTGAGMGFSLHAFKTMSLDTYVAKPLNSLDEQDFDNHIKVHFSLSFNF